jgi:hypothetical protein
MAYDSNCADCKYCINAVSATLSGDRTYCEAPPLSDLLDGEPPHHNTIAECNSVRDFRVACGHDARWFIRKEGS